MPTDPARIASLMQDAIASASQSYADGGSLAAFEKEMGRIVARGHAAAWMAGTSERLRIPLDSPLLSQARLSKAERADIKALVQNQLGYLKDFTSAAGDMSPEAIAARAGLYAGATRASYYKSAIEAPPPCVPGDCEQCLSNCRCSLDVRDDGVYWQCAADDKSCEGCVSRGSEWQPYKEDGAEDKPEAAPDAAETAGEATAPESAPLDARDFGNNTAEMRAWGDEHFGGWADELNENERQAVASYKDQLFDVVNSDLRGGAPLSSEIDRAVTEIDSALAKGRLPESIVAYRGLSTVEGMDLRVGGTISDNAFVSTSLRRRTAEGYAGQDGALIQVHIAQGTEGAYVGAISGGHSEFELLLGRDAEFRIREIIPAGDDPMVIVVDHIS